MCRRSRRRSDYLLVGLAWLALTSCGGGLRAGGKDGVCHGGKVWHQEDAARLRGCLHIRGDLWLGGALESTEDLAGLQSVEGNIVIGPSYQLTNLSDLGSLHRVGGDLRVEGNWRLAGLFFGELRTVGGAVQIRNNSGLSTCALHALTAFGSLRIEGNSRLERVDLSGLPEAGPAGLVVGQSLSSVLAPTRIDRSVKPEAETHSKGS